MGQARLRGKFKDRSMNPKILNLDKMSVAEIKEFFDCPESAIFKGYVIHSEVNDNYLTEFIEEIDTVFCLYSSNPIDSMIFDTYKKAEKTSSVVPTDCSIGVLFDCDEKTGVWFLNAY